MHTFITVKKYNSGLVFMKRCLTDEMIRIWKQEHGTDLMTIFAWDTIGRCQPALQFEDEYEALVFKLRFAV